MKIITALAGKVSGLWNGTIEPALEALWHTVEHDAVVALQAVIEQAATQLPAIAVAPTTLSQKVQAIADLAVKTAQIAEASALAVTEHDVATAVVAWTAQAASKPAI